MKLRATLLSATLLAATLGLASCGGLGWGPKADLEAQWNFKAVEALVFPNQEKEREFSSLVADSDSLYLIAERVGVVLRLEHPVSPYSTFEEVSLWAREGAQYEGAALVGGYLLVLDEYSKEEEGVPPLLVKVSLGSPGQRIEAYPLRLDGLDCRDGDCLEGLAVTGGRLYILDERDRLATGACAGRLYSMSLAELESGSFEGAASFELPLPNCQWRYTDLHAASIGERPYLLALKSRCYRSRPTLECDEDEYAVELINPEAGPTVVSSYHFPEATMRWWRRASVSRNLEGITVGPGGDLYIVSDNLWPQGGTVKSLLLRVPKR